MNTEHIIKNESLYMEKNDIKFTEDEVEIRSLNENSLDLYNERFIVFEGMTKDIEMYQVKMFYYQTIPGLMPFRFSMSQNKSYLYFKKEDYIDFTDLKVSNLNANDLLRILEQIKSIYDMCLSYLLYEENIQIKPNRIKIIKSRNELIVNCMYLPIKKTCTNVDFEDFAQFTCLLSKMFNAVDYMEGYYYFTRLYQDICEGRETLGLYKHLCLFLENNRVKILNK